MRCLRVALMFFAVPILVAQNPEPASVQGLAVIAGSDDPVPRAVIELRRIGDGAAEPVLAATQSNGAFLFRAVPAGRYTLVATRNGYLPAESGQRSSGSPGVPIVIAAGQLVTGIRVAMTPTAAISGRILDRGGQAMPGVAVQLLKPLFQDGRRTMVVMKSMLTNDLGEYRIFWVPPDSYYVNVIPPPDTPAGGGTPLVLSPFGQPTGRSLWSNQSNIAVSPVGNGLPETEAYLPIFFPGTADENAATLVELQPGADVRGIDIHVAPFRAARIRGLVLNGTSRQPMPGIGVQLMSIGANPRTLQTTSDAMGRYAIPKVPAGPYLLASLAQQAGMGRLMPVEVRDTDMEANIELQPFYTVSGRIVAPNPTAFSVRLRLDYGISNAPQFNVTPAADGSFTLRTVPAGEYRLYVNPILLPQVPTPPSVPQALANSYVKAMRMGDLDLLNGRLHVDSQPESRIEITVATDSGSLSGRVLDRRQSPASAVNVVLLPDVDRRLLRTDLYKTAITDETGRFLMEGLPPGDYRVFSWETVAIRAWQDPAFMRAYEEQGRAVHITGGARQTVELTSIP